MGIKLIYSTKVPEGKLGYMSFKYHNNTAIIRVRRDLPALTKAFVLAHEIGHYFQRLNRIIISEEDAEYNADKYFSKSIKRYIGTELYSEDLDYVVFNLTGDHIC